MASILLGRKEVEQVIDVLTPSIVNLSERAMVKRYHLSICVLDPLAEKRKYELDSRDTQLITFAQRSFGAEEDWENPYNTFALSKALLTLRTGYSSREVQEQYPHLYDDEYEASNCKYGGSVIFNGIIVGCSGVQPWWDETIALWVASGCWASMKTKLHNVLADNKKHFVTAA